MLEADTIINPESFAIGINIELGFCTAWKETSKLMKEILNRDLSDENKIKELDLDYSDYNIAKFEFECLQLNNISQYLVLYKIEKW